MSAFYGICPECRRPNDRGFSGKCRYCGKKTLFVQPSYVFSREIFIEGKRPEQAEPDYLRSCEFGSGQMGEVERKVAKRKRKISCGLGSTELVCGSILFAVFAFISLHMLAYICLLMMLHGVWLLISATVKYRVNTVAFGKQGSVFGAFTHFWMYSVFSDEYEQETEFKPCELAAASALRHVPEGYRVSLNSGDITVYIEGLKNTMKEALFEQAQMARSLGLDWKDNGIVPSTPEKNLQGPGRVIDICEIDTQINFIFKAINSSSEIHLAKVVIYVRQTCIRNGKYWFMYDLTPAYTIAPARQDSIDFHEEEDRATKEAMEYIRKQYESKK